MPQFEMETSLALSPDQLASELLLMSGVNDELAPFLKMSAPQPWALTPISEWPMNKELFTSRVLLLGLLPIDLHRFKFVSLDRSGFKESSRTLLNAQWCHQRIISAKGSGSSVRDIVYYEGKLAIVGRLLKPLYHAIFVHRHKRLAAKYAGINIGSVGNDCSGRGK